jgi:hypothetical protein
MKTKTLFFENYFNVNIDDFNTTTEINEFIERQTGKKLKVSKFNSNLL